MSKRKAFAIVSISCAVAAAMSSCIPIPIPVGSTQTVTTTHTTTTTSYNTQDTQTVTKTQTFTTYNDGGTAPTSWADAYEKVKDSVCIVKADAGQGSGWVYDSDGIIVTNAHVVEDTTSVTIVFDDGTEYYSERFYYDTLTDVGVIFVDAHDLKAAEVADPSLTRIGDAVATVGNGNGYGISLKGGWISKLDIDINLEGQLVYDLMETDVAINAGNSGGPIINIYGQVVGIANSKTIQYGIEGMTYGVNMKTGLPVIEQLIANGKVTRGYLGVSNMRATENGVLIGTVLPETPAATAGLKSGDVIEMIGGKKVSTSKEIFYVISDTPAGTEIEIIYSREGNSHSTTVTLVERPD